MILFCSLRSSCLDGGMSVRNDFSAFSLEFKVTSFLLLQIRLSASCAFPVLFHYLLCFALPVQYSGNGEILAKSRHTEPEKWYKREIDKKCFIIRILFQESFSTIF